MAGSDNGAYDREGEQCAQAKDRIGKLCLAAVRKLHCGDLVVRDNAIPPKRSARDNVTSDQARRAATRRPILPTP